MHHPSKQFVIRLDDIGRDLKSEVDFMELALRSGLKVSCGVVPAWLSNPAGKRLRAWEALYHQALEIHLHGYAHVDYRLTLAETKYEFGPARSFDEQLRDVRRGLSLLRTEFGPLFTPVFSPPFGEYDDNTVLALQECGVMAISGLRPDPTLGHLAEFPGNVDFFRWNPPREKSLCEITDEWQQIKTNVRVFVVHPEIMCDTSAKQLISLFLTWDQETPMCLFRDLLTVNHQS